jgi:glucose/arabinose dehydrogenase
VKANGTILRVGLDGSDLQVFAWGLRNPFGLAFGPDGRLFASDNGFDERGSRPIANAPDCLWHVRQDAWYGWPDFAAGIPVTDPRYKPTRGAAPALLLEKHPPCETPLLTRPPHTAMAKLEVARGPRFGPAGTLFVAEFGGGEPATGPTAASPAAGFGVVRVDLATKQLERFFGASEGAVGPEGWESVVTAGPRRPIDVRLSPDGEALYIVDFGAMAFFPAGAGPGAHPFPGSGVLWRVVREGAPEQAPPANLSPVPGRGRAAK